MKEIGDGLDDLVGGTKDHNPTTVTWFYTDVYYLNSRMMDWFPISNHLLVLSAPPVERGVACGMTFTSVSGVEADRGSRAD